MAAIRRGRHDCQDRRLSTWVAWLLTENFAAIRMPGDAFAISLTIGEARASLAYRESDIGIRAFEPEEANLAARQLGEVAYAVYIRRNTAESDQRWIAVAEEEAISAYLRWPHAHATTGIVATVNRPRSLPDLVRAYAWQDRASLFRRRSPSRTAAAGRRVAGVTPPAMDRHECRGSSSPGDPHGRRPHDQAHQKLCRSLRWKTTEPRLMHVTQNCAAVLAPRHA